MTNESLSKPNHNLTMLFYSNCSTPLIEIPTSQIHSLIFKSFVDIHVKGDYILIHNVSHVHIHVL